MTNTNPAFTPALDLEVEIGFGTAVPGVYNQASSIAALEVRVQPSRSAVVPRPKFHVVLSSATARFVVLTAPNKVSHEGMDGVAEIRIDQGSRVGMLAYIETRAKVAITQALTQAIYTRAFRPATEGGDPIENTSPTVAASIFDTIQYTDEDPDGYNLSVEYELGVNVGKGGSTIVLETVIELKTGEKLLVKGRCFVTPNLSEPLNVY